MVAEGCCNVADLVRIGEKFETAEREKWRELATTTNGSD
jgi:hypothetical protein